MNDTPHYPGPNAPARKSNTLRNILLVILGVSILGCGGCFAVTGLFVNEVDNAIEKAEEEDKEPGGPDNPMTIEPGKAFEVNGFEYKPGWKIGAGPIGAVDITGLKVENARDDKDSALVEIKVWQGKEVLALADCTTEPIAVGTVTTLSCLSGDDMPKKYDRITINDTF